MPARRMRIEVFDSEGNKYSIAFEGQVTRDKAIRILDLVELLGGISSSGTTSESNITLNEQSKYERVLTLIQKRFALVWFSSKEVQSVYEQEFKEPISLSTIATYLSRMATKGILVKTGASNRLKYRVAPSLPHVTLKSQIP